jgi:hypothetical protein
MLGAGKNQDYRKFYYSTWEGEGWFQSYVGVNFLLLLVRKKRNRILSD